MPDTSLLSAITKRSVMMETIHNHVAYRCGKTQIDMGFHLAISNILSQLDMDELIAIQQELIDTMASAGSPPKRGLGRHDGGDLPDWAKKALDV